MVADPKDCRMYYVCRGDQPAYHAMCPQTPLPTLFNFNLQACTNTANTCVPDPCYNETGIFVPDVSGICGYWHFCLEGDVSHSGQCPHNLSFDPITQFCTYPHCSGDEDSVFYF